MRSFASRKVMAWGLSVLLLVVSVPSETYCSCSENNTICCAALPTTAQGSECCAVANKEVTSPVCGGCSAEVSNVDPESPSIGSPSCQRLRGDVVTIQTATVPGSRDSDKPGSSLLSVETISLASIDAILSPSLPNLSNLEARPPPNAPVYLLFSSLLI